MSMSPPWTVCIVSTSRADYGCLRRLMIEVRDDPQLRLSLVMIGRHWRAEDGLPVALLVDADSNADDASSVGRALGRAVSQLADAIPRLAPQVIVILGDRYEIMAPALAALIHNIPVAHLHGGELSEGAIDDSIRHAVTKLAHLHFVSTEQYAARVRQMGEAPDTVFCVGAPALDGLASQEIMTRAELEKEIGLSLAQPVALVTYHPVTREPGSAGLQIANLLNAIERSGIPAVFTVANADVAGREINAELAAFVARDTARYKLFTHLGQKRYFACLKYCALMIGNSSSGIIEAPSFGLPVVNVGRRQDGRIRGRNVIDVGYGADEILAAITRALEPQFRADLQGSRNPYDPYADGRNSWRIKEVLKRALAAGIGPHKKFVDHVGGGHG